MPITSCIVTLQAMATDRPTNSATNLVTDRSTDRETYLDRPTDLQTDMIPRRTREGVVVKQGTEVMTGTWVQPALPRW